MILLIVKLIDSARWAIAGRKYPHQLAWAVAFGLLLGVVPHGNLLAFGLVILVLSLKINHAMAGLTAVIATFLAAYLDPYSHEVGNFVLTHPQLNQAVALAWTLPLVPWTDLNNTVTMGSILIGMSALAPVFVITYPIFRLLAPLQEATDADRKDPIASPELAQNQTAHQVVLIDHGHTVPSRPNASSRSRWAAEPSALKRGTAEPGSTVATEQAEHLDFIEIEPEPDTPDDPQVAVETRIDVIRMTDHRPTEDELAARTADAIDPEPMDEALNYLLRQLRDSQQRKAA